MLITLTLPRINQHMTVAVIGRIYAAESDFLNIGAKLMDLSIDLSAVAPHDCPPISRYRIVLRDRVWVRRLVVSTGDDVAPGADLAIFSTEADEPITGPPGRAARVTVAGILDLESWEGARS